MATKILDSTPPREVFLGYIIEHHPMASDACKWVIYDGDQPVKCYSRRDAELYAIEQTHRRQPNAITTILMNRLDAALSDAATILQAINQGDDQEIINILPKLKEIQQWSREKLQSAHE